MMHRARAHMHASTLNWHIAIFFSSYFFFSRAVFSMLQRRQCRCTLCRTAQNHRQPQDANKLCIYRRHDEPPPSKWREVVDSAAGDGTDAVRVAYAYVNLPMECRFTAWCTHTRNGWRYCDSISRLFFFFYFWVANEMERTIHNTHTHTHWHAQAMARTPHTDTRTNIFPSMSLNFTENRSIRMLAPVRGAHWSAYICAIGKFRCGVVSVSVERVLTYAMRLPVCN